MYRVVLVLLAMVVAAAGPAPDAPAPGDVSTGDVTPVGWAWQQIQVGKDADFNQRCGTDRLDPHAPDDPRWAAPCRLLDPAEPRTLLVRPALAHDAPHGVRIRGARLDSTLDLDDTHIEAAELTLIDCRLNGDLLLSEAQLDGSFDLNGSMVAGSTDASSAHVSRFVEFVNKASIGGSVDFSAGTIGGGLFLIDATMGGLSASAARIGNSLTIFDSIINGAVAFIGVQVQGPAVIGKTGFKGDTPVEASTAQISGVLAVQDSSFGGGLHLTAASVGQNIAMTGVTFADGKPLIAANLDAHAAIELQNVVLGGGLNLNSANVGKTLDLTDVTFGAGAEFTATALHVGGRLQSGSGIRVTGGVLLDKVSIEGDLIILGAKVAQGKSFSVRGAHIGGDLDLSDGDFGGDVNLFGADVHGQLNLPNTRFGPDATLTLERAHVAQDVFLRDAAAARPVNALLLDAGSLDLRGTTLGGLDLTGASIEGDLRLAGIGGDGHEARTRWTATGGALPKVVLRNTRVGALQDDEHAWDGAELVLEGFTYTHLGGFGGVDRDDMRNRPIKPWRKWLLRDPVYSPQPYAQLASVLTAGGNSETAAQIRFIGRDRERTEKLAGCHWLHPGTSASNTPRRPCDLAGWTGLSILQATIGYGIGQYTFRALWWTLGLTLAGTIILTYAPGVRTRGRFGDPGPRQKPLLWCFGAVLNHVLPVVTLSAEFNDFFNDSRGERLYAWQKVAFALLALSGWALSFFVVAAISGLTQT